MTDLKQLTEWSRKFLADNTCYVLSSDMAESCLFHKWHIAPVLMHLSKREMEKRGFEIEYNKYQSQGYQFRISLHEPLPTDCDQEKLRRYLDNETKRKWVCDENEYIAFWSAVMQAIKEK